MCTQKLGCPSVYFHFVVVVNVILQGQQIKMWPMIMSPKSFSACFSVYDRTKQHGQEILKQLKPIPIALYWTPGSLSILFTFIISQSTKLDQCSVWTLIRAKECRKINLHTLCIALLSLYSRIIEQHGILSSIWTQACWSNT